MNSGSSPKSFCAWALASSSTRGSRRGSNVTSCDRWRVALVSASSCTSSMCLWTNSGGASRPGTRSHPGTANRSAAPTLTNGPPFSRRPMLPSSRCSTHHQTQTRSDRRRRQHGRPAPHVAGRSKPRRTPCTGSPGRRRNRECRAFTDPCVPAGMATSLAGVLAKCRLARHGPPGRPGNGTDARLACSRARSQAVRGLARLVVEDQKCSGHLLHGCLRPLSSQNQMGSRRGRVPATELHQHADGHLDPREEGGLSTRWSVAALPCRPECQNASGRDRRGSPGGLNPVGSEPPTEGEAPQRALAGPSDDGCGVPDTRSVR